jgi:hypothetical protein
MNQPDMFNVYSPLEMDPLMAPVHGLPHLELPMSQASASGAAAAGTPSEDTPLQTPTHHPRAMSAGQLSDQFASVDRPSSSEEKDLTSAQIRRKAQNRAA